MNGEDVLICADRLRYRRAIHTRGRAMARMVQTSRRVSLIVTALVAVVLGLSEAAVAGADDTPLTFRGIPLGMSIEEFHQLPHPDADEISSSRHARVLCTGDPATGDAARVLRRPDVVGADAVDLKLCQFFDPTLDDSVEEIDVAGVDEAPEFIFYRDRADDGPYRLASIAILDRKNNFARFRKAYTEKFGKPTKVEHKSAADATGGSVAREIDHWVRDDVGIDLVQRLDDDGHPVLTEISYTKLSLLKKLMDATAAAEKKMPKGDAGKL